MGGFLGDGLFSLDNMDMTSYDIKRFKNCTLKIDQTNKNNKG